MANCGKRKSVVVSMELRLDALKRIDKGKSLKSIALYFGVGESTRPLQSTFYPAFKDLDGCQDVDAEDVEQWMAVDKNLQQENFSDEDVVGAVTDGFQDDEDGEDIIENSASLISNTACNSAYKTNNRDFFSTATWWTQKLETEKRKLLAFKRQSQRDESATLKEKSLRYKMERAKYISKVRQTKTTWNEECNKATYPFGKQYKIAFRKDIPPSQLVALSNKNPTGNHLSIAEDILENLYHVPDIPLDSSLQIIGTHNDEPFTEEEITSVLWGPVVDPRSGTWLLMKCYPRNGLQESRFINTCRLNQPSSIEDLPHPVQIEVKVSGWAFHPSKHLKKYQISLEDGGYSNNFINMNFDGSKTEFGVGCAFCVLEGQNITHSWSERLSNKITVFQAELIALRESVKFAKDLNTDQIINIHLDNRATSKPYPILKRQIK
ncbi:hypothetical protein AVEN_37286-1 [Araneus ventricosus]|uniref:RNase H type-1 domain-containing protein n=1 Tax=Araneus ventricosus TaxID=182803 RepID=A0A4Y2KF17_ARAVE|nr:hypothetical protein AVEN_37286-1 [Araneus ventricosus]